MITLRPTKARSNANFGWLDSKHTFSFSDFYNQNYMGFFSLWGIDGERMQAAKGFSIYNYRKSIVSYFLERKPECRDSIDKGLVIRPGNLQSQ